MYEAPPALQARVFARLPEALRSPRKASDWIAVRRKGRAVHSFLEGPAFDRDGNLWLVDLAYSRILRVSPAGEFGVAADYDGEPNGIAIHRDGRVVIADHRRGLLALDPKSRSISPLLERRHLESFKGLNDLVFAANGDLYFTDQGETGLHDPTGRVFRLGADGRLELLVGTVPSPNGIALNPDGSILYVAATRGNAIWRLPIEADGSVSRAGIFIQLSGGLAGPDGLAVDEAGNLAVCVNGLGTVWLFSRLGEPILRIKAPEGLATTNAAFGGRERRSLYITEGDTGTVLVADLPAPGMTLYSHR